MIVSIMQPYFFPYIGYMQLIAQSEVFVFQDDVQYIKRGWVNRNRILGPNDAAAWLTLPVAAAGHELAICDRAYLLHDNADRVLRRIESTYRKAPQFAAVFPLIRSIMAFPGANVAAFNVNLLQTLAGFLRLAPRFVRSSTIPNLAGLTGQARIIAICQGLGATRYVNSIGGTSLYDAPTFRDNGIDLEFLQTTISAQPGALMHLSFLHALLHDSPDTISHSLTQYQVGPAGAVMPPA